MTASAYVTVWCDNLTNGLRCHRFLETEYRTAARARKKARGEGWKTALPGGRDLCPRHDRLSGPRP